MTCHHQNLPPCISTPSIISGFPVQDTANPTGWGCHMPQNPNQRPSSPIVCLPRLGRGTGEARLVTPLREELPILWGQTKGRIGVQKLLFHGTKQQAQGAQIHRPIQNPAKPYASKRRHCAWCLWEAFLLGSRKTLWHRFPVP